MPGNNGPDSSPVKNPFKGFPGLEPLPKLSTVSLKGTHVISLPRIPTLRDLLSVRWTVA